MTRAGGVAGDQLRAFVERIERLEEEKQTIVDDIKDVYAEAKANGFDTKIIRQIVRLRKMDAAERQEQEALLDLYMHALGMSTAERLEATEAATGQIDIETSIAGARAVDTGYVQ
tara:strand:+ start:5960 stop:6304 length:345 start_codon:yes stop_codon:yes gene_type:complete